MASHTQILKQCAVFSALVASITWTLPSSAQYYDPNRAYREQESRQRAERQARDQTYQRQTDSARETYNSRMNSLNGSFNKLYSAISEYERERNSGGGSTISARILTQPETEAERLVRLSNYISAQAAAGNVDAITAKAHATLEGRGFAKSAPEAIKLFTQAAEKGNKVSVAWLATIFSGRFGVPADEAKELHWSMKAVDAGLVEYSENVAAILLEGGVVPPSDPQKLALYKKYLEIGKQNSLPWADTNQGMHLLNGDFGPPSAKQAMPFLEKTAEKDELAAYMLGSILYYGKGGVPRDIPKAKRHWQYAASKDVVWAKFEYARNMLDPDSAGGVDVARSLAYALDVAKDPLSSKEEKARVARLAGLCYAASAAQCGIPANPKSAFEWFHIAAENGSVIGRWETALAYGAGRGVAKHEGEALRRFQAMDKDDLPQGTYQVGFYLYNGRGTPVNKGLALDFYTRAASNGDLTAAKWIVDNFAEYQATPSPNKTRWTKAEADNALRYNQGEEKRDAYRFFWEDWEKRQFEAIEKAKQGAK
jgi:uncharacterized protein